MSDSVGIGDIWYVQLKGASAVAKLKVIDLTAKTVLLTNKVDQAWYGITSYRHKIDDVEFIELCPPTMESGQ
jgi:hypothetical protein